MEERPILVHDYLKINPKIIENVLRNKLFQFIYDFILRYPNK